MKILRRIWDDVRRGENIDLYLAIFAAFLSGILSLVLGNQLLVAVTLFAIGAVMISLLRVRYILEEYSDKLTHTTDNLTEEYAHIDNLLQKIMSSYTHGIEFLDDSPSVINALEDMVRKSDEFIMTIGSKSTAGTYLEGISQRVLSRGVTYYRLLTGDHITHDLHVHLDNLIFNQDTKIAWNLSEKYVTLSVSEKHAIQVLPTPYATKFMGIKLLGERNARLYAQYFTQAFDQSIQIKTLFALSVLCEKCRPDIARNEKRIEQILRKELKASEKL